MYRSLLFDNNITIDEKEACFMRVKFWTVFFVILAIICLYGCDRTELKQEDMVLNPSAVKSDNLSCEIDWHC